MRNSLLRGLGLVVSDPPAGDWQRGSCALEFWDPSGLDVVPSSEAIIAEPSIPLQCSDFYDAWISSWCFQPTSPETLGVVSPSLQPGISLSPDTSSQRTSPVQEKTVTHDFTEVKTSGEPRFPSGARASWVVSGVDNLRNIRDLLAILDEAVAHNNTQLPMAEEDGRGESRDLRWRDIERPDSEVVTAGLAL